MRSSDDAASSASDQDGTEVELKLLLDSEGDAERLRAWLEGIAGPGERRAQVNTYFDTADLRLRAARAMVRVRVDGVGVRVTLKQKPELRDGLMQVHEIEAAAPEALAMAFRGAAPARLQSAQLPFASAIDALIGADPRGGALGWTLHGLGALANLRLRYRVPIAAFMATESQHSLVRGRSDTVLFELDRSLGPAGEPRHELEVEDPDVPALRDAIEALLDGLDVSFRPADMSKYAWFLRGLERVPDWSDSESEH